MKVIERQMQDAIRDRRNWRGNNTRVDQFDTFSSVSLFGKHIANVAHSDGYVYVNLRTLQDWPTVTTMSRLKALGVNVYQRKGRVFLNDVAIN